MTNYINEYYQKINDGSIIAGFWVKQLYSYIQEGLSKKWFYYDHKKAQRAILFIESFCHHCEGRNDLLKLELWQKAALSLIFGIVDNSGARQFREVVLIVARKNGKSLLAAAIIAYMVFLDGEWGAKAYCLAPKLDQAEIVYNAFWQTIQSEPELETMIKSRKSDFYIEETNSSVKKIAFNAKKSDGFNPHLTICDEIASWQGDAGKKQYEVMKSALGARKQPLLFSISTAGYINGGVYDELYSRGTRFLSGGSKETRLLPIFYTIDDVDRWSDINEIAKANPNLNISVSVDYMLEEIAIAEQSLSKKAEFICKYCNIKQNSSQAWLTSKIIERAESEPATMEDFKKCYCVAGIDLSQTTDLTSCALIIERDGKLYCLVHFWLPAERLTDAINRDGIPYDEYIQKGYLTLSGDNYVDYKDVYNYLINAVEKYSLLPLKVGYDRYSSQYLIQDLKAYGFNCDDVYQGYNLTGVIYEFEGIIKDGSLKYCENDLFKIHMYDVALDRDTRNNRVKISKLNKDAHIDGVAAVLDALTVRQKYYGEIGSRLANKKRDKEGGAKN